MKELGDLERQKPSSRPLPIPLTQQNAAAPQGIYAQDVVWEDNENLPARHEAALEWLETKLQLFEPLHWLQKAELRRMIRWLSQGRVVDAERCIVNLIDLEVWKD